PGAVLRPPAHRVQPDDSAGGQARGVPAQGAAQGRVRRRAAARDRAAAQAGLHDPARPPAADGAERSGRRAVGARTREEPRHGAGATVLARAAGGAPAGTHEREGVRVVLFGAGRGTRAGFLREAVFAARRAAGAVLAESAIDVLNVYQPLSGYGVLGLAAARR